MRIICYSNLIIDGFKLAVSRPSLTSARCLGIWKERGFSLVVRYCSFGTRELIQEQRLMRKMVRTGKDSFCVLSYYKFSLIKKLLSYQAVILELLLKLGVSPKQISLGLVWTLRMIPGRAGIVCGNAALPLQYSTWLSHQMAHFLLLLENVTDLSKFGLKINNVSSCQLHHSIYFFPL